MKVKDDIEYGFVEIKPLELSTVDTGDIILNKPSIPNVCLVRIESGSFKGQYALVHGLRHIKFGDKYLVPKADFIQTVELEDGDYVCEFDIIKPSEEQFISTWGKN